MKQLSTLTIMALVCLATAAHAGDGRTPLWEATTIDEDGTYLLIRDIETTTGSAIRLVPPAEHVVLDLNGFSIRVGSDSGIDVKSVQEVVIRNGSIESDDDGIVADNVERLVIEDVFVDSGQFGIYLDDVRDFSVRDNFIEASDYGVFIVADSYAIHGAVSDNDIRTDGFRTIFMDDASPDPADNSTVHVQRNTTKGTAIEIEYSYGSRITDNSIDAAGSSPALRLDNTSRSLVSGNVVRGGFYGISVTPGGAYNRIEDNQIIGGGYGLRLEGDHNVYRGNMIRDYSIAPVQDTGVGNTDAGGNVY